MQRALRQLVFVVSHGHKRARQRLEQAFSCKHAAEVIARRGALRPVSNPTSGESIIQAWHLHFKYAADTIHSHPDEVFLVLVILIHHIDQSFKALVGMWGVSHSY